MSGLDIFAWIVLLIAMLCVYLVLLFALVRLGIIRMRTQIAFLGAAHRGSGRLHRSKREGRSADRSAVRLLRNSRCARAEPQAAPDTLLGYANVNGFLLIRP